MPKESKKAAEMPIGLLMSLGVHPDAMHSFSLLSDEKQGAVIRYVEDARTGGEAKDRIAGAVEDLEHGSTGFLG